MLTRRGWAVEVAATISEAVPLVEQVPDWVVLDLMLPDGDGTHLMRKIRAEGIATRVAVTTGSSDAARLREVIDLRPELLLTKPILPAELFDALDGPG